MTSTTVADPTPATPTPPTTPTTPSSGPSLPGDADRARGLRRMRLVALSLLIVAAAVFVVTLNRGGAWAYVHATAEASMVGALADWFAVTALFRRPLGLPIPHTALIPNKKNQLARSLQDFVTENFLASDVVTERVRSAQIAARLGRWVADPAHSARVVAEAATASRRALARIDDEGVAEIVTSEVMPRLAREPLSAIAGRLVEAFVADRAYTDSLDLVLAELHRWLTDHHEAVESMVEDRSPGWTPNWVDRRLARRVARELIDWVADIKDDPDHPARQALDDVLARFADDLQHDPDTMARAERFKERMLATPQVLSTATSLWHLLRRVADAALADPESSLSVRITGALARFGERLGHDDALRERVDTMVADAASYAVSRYGHELTSVITHTIESWDGAEASRRIELHVGRDLQFIRINGTLVGALAGLVIYSLGRLI